MPSSIRNCSYFVHKTCVKISTWGELIRLKVPCVTDLQDPFFSFEFLNFFITYFLLHSLGVVVINLALWRKYIFCNIADLQDPFFSSNILVSRIFFNQLISGHFSTSSMMDLRVMNSKSRGDIPAPPSQFRTQIWTRSHKTFLTHPPSL